MIRRCYVLVFLFQSPPTSPRVQPGRIAGVYLEIGPQDQFFFTFSEWDREETGLVYPPERATPVPYGGSPPSKVDPVSSPPERGSFVLHIEKVK